MKLKRFFFNFNIGIQALLNNRFRAILTSLGIIFGVASVIAMLAIGKGAEKEILEQIKQVGSNNVIIKSQMPDQKSKNDGDQSSSDNNTSSTANTGKQEKKNFSMGLSMDDARDILENISTVKYVSPETEMQTEFMFDGLNMEGKLIGVTNYYFEATNVTLAKGRFLLISN